MRCVVLVLSDKGSRGEREDTSGPTLVKMLEDWGYPDATLELLPDDQATIAERLTKYADKDNYQLVLTCGGTGVSPRDVTPEATAQVLERALPGFGECMRAASLEKSPHAIVSRAIAGIRGETLIVNLPGSPKAARENLEAVWPAVPHLVAKMTGDSSDCASL